MATFDLSLLPQTAAIDSGRLRIGGVDVGELARDVGTPVYIYDEDHFRARAARFCDLFGSGNVAYAGKAFLCRAMAKLADECGLLLDVAGLGELHIALSSGFRPERIILHGNNKSDVELELALTSGVGRIVVDSFDEIDRLETLVERMNVVPNLMVRVTPGVEAHTHEFIETGTENSKFGFTVSNGVALNAAWRIIENEKFHLLGFHCHIGSQVLRSDGHVRAIEVVADLSAELFRKFNFELTELNVGGGFAVRYVEEDESFDDGQMADGIKRALIESHRLHGLNIPTLLVEPGRALIGSAAITVYEVGTIKRIPDIGTYVAVNGGISDNLRPMLYGARYEAFCPDRADHDLAMEVDIAGMHCEQGDVLIRGAMVPTDLAVGDLIAVAVTGAYHHSMANNYNGALRPPVVFVRAGQARIAVRRESLEDLTRRG